MIDKMRAWLTETAWPWLQNTDEGTWIGHWIQGLGCFWVGYLPVSVAYGQVVAMGVGVLTGFLVVALVFAHREGSNMLDGIKKYGARLAIRKKGLDGLMDWLMPALACFADIQLVRGSFDGFIAACIATALVWLGAFLTKRD